MGALASLATVLGAGATIYGNVRATQTQQAANRAQAQITAAQQVAQQQSLLAQEQQQALQRQRRCPTPSPRPVPGLGAAGIAPDAGSAAALTAGLTQEAAAAQGTNNAIFRPPGARPLQPAEPATAA